MLLLSLAVAATLAGCAAATSGRELRGESGQVAWEVIDARQRMAENGARMRWEYVVLLRNRGLTVITFERMELGSRSVGPSDIWGGIESQPFTRRLEPNRELRVSRSDSWGCPRCGLSELPRVFAEGFIRTITFTGRDALGARVKVDVQIGLNSGVGVRQ
jgi:hypothetical protein